MTRRQRRLRLVQCLGEESLRRALAKAQREHAAAKRDKDSRGVQAELRARVRFFADALNMLLEGAA